MSNIDRGPRREEPLKLEPIFYRRRAVCVPYKDHFTECGHVEVCQWHNGEGMTIMADEAEFSLTWAQWDALKKAVKLHLNYDYTAERAKNMGYE